MLSAWGRWLFWSAGRKVARKAPPRADDGFVGVLQQLLGMSYYGPQPGHQG